MQRTAYFCDICEAEVSYKRAPIVAQGLVVRHRRDWNEYPRKNGETALICTSCEHVLLRARELAITYPEPSDVISVGDVLAHQFGYPPQRIPSTSE